MEPIEIEFLMKDKLSDGVKNAQDKTSDLGKTAEQVSKAIIDKIADQKLIIKDVQADLKKLNKEYENMAPGTAQLEMKAEIEACSRALKEEEVILIDLEGQHKKNSTAAKKLTTELRELLDSLARMRLEGKELTPEYEEMSNKAALLTDTIGDLRTQTNILAHDNSGLQGVISGINGAAGVMTTATGIMGVFVSDHEDLIKIQTRVQSVMAITMGLQQVMNTLNKDSAFRLVTVNNIKKKMIAVNTRLATSLGISTVAATALMAALTLGLSVAITGVVMLFSKLSSANAKAKKDQAEFAKKVADSSASILADFKKISDQWSSLTDDLKAKQSFIDSNQEAFKKLGVSINSVSDAEKLFVNNKDAFIESIKYRAMAAASMDLASEKYKEAIQKMIEADAMSDTKTVYYSNGNFAPGGSYTMENKDKKRAEEAANSLFKEGDEFITKANEWEQHQTRILKNLGLEAQETIVEGSIEALEKLISEKEKALKKIPLSNKKLYNSAFKELQIYKDQLSTLTQTKESNKTNISLSSLEYKAEQKILDQRLALQKEGYEKQREQAKLNWNRQKQDILIEESDRLKVIADMKANGVPVKPESEGLVRSQTAIQLALAAELYDKELKDISKKETEETKKRFEELIQPYLSFNEKRINIEQDYAAKIKELQETGASSEHIENAEREKEDLLTEIDFYIAQKDATFQVMMQRIASMSITQLEKSLKEAEDLLANSTTSNNTNEQIATLRAKIKILQDELKLAKAQDEANDKDPKLKWEKTSKAVKNCKTEIDGIISSMDFLDEGTKSALEAVSNVAGGAIDMIDGIKALSIGAAESISAVEKASIILAIVGTAVKIMTAIFSMSSASEKRHREALAEIQERQLSFQREYNLLLAKQNLLLKESQSIFGENKIESAIAQVEAYRKLLELYQNTLRGSKPEYSLSPLHNFLSDYSGRMKAYEKGVGALYDTKIVTGHKKTGLFGWGRGRDTYSNILSIDHYKDLVDQTGKLDAEMLRLILKNEKMTDETRRQLEYILSIDDALKEAEKALDDYLQDTFGNLGQGFVNSVAESIKQNKDVIQLAANEIGQVFEKLGEQIAYSMFFADEFKELESEIKKVYGSSKDKNTMTNEIASTLDEFFNNMSSNLENAQDWMKQWQSKVAELGHDIYRNEQQQSGQAGAFQLLTQDQGTKLEGLFTSGQVHWYNIDTGVERINVRFGEALSGINKIAEHTSHIETILTIMNVAVRDGIKIK